MLILKNVTAVQLHPASVREGVDIAIDKDVIVEVGDALTQRYPRQTAPSFPSTNGQC